MRGRRRRNEEHVSEGELERGRLNEGVRVHVNGVRECAQLAGDLLVVIDLRPLRATRKCFRELHDSVDRSSGRNAEPEQTIPHPRSRVLTDGSGKRTR